MAFPKMIGRSGKANSSDAIRNTSANRNTVLRSPSLDLVHQGVPTSVTTIPSDLDPRVLVQTHGHC